jgi:hypothetical protein
MSSLTDHWSQYGSNPASMQKFLLGNQQYTKDRTASDLGVDPGYVDNYFKNAGLVDPWSWNGTDQINPPAAAPPADPAGVGTPFSMVGGNQPLAPAPASGIISGAAPAPAPTPAPATAAPSPFTYGGNSPGTSPAPAPTGGLQSFFNANRSNPAAVQQYMQQNGYTNESAAKELGIDPGYVNNYFNGPTPAPGTPGGPAGPIPGSNSTSVGIVSNQSRQLGTPTQWNIDPSQTVQGRIASIVDPNSPIVQQAQAQAKIDAAGRGLSNTSMAVTAGQAAAYQAALPIAQADAATAAKAAGYNANTANDFAGKNIDSSNQFALADKSIGAQLSLADKNIASQKDLAGINRDTQMQIGKMNIGAQATANKLAQENQTLISTNGSAAAAFNQGMAAINNINLNDKMDGPHKTEAVAQVWHSVQTQLKVLGSVSNLNLSSDLSLANTPGFDAQGNWIGFPTGDATAPDAAHPGLPASPVMNQPNTY